MRKAKGIVVYNGETNQIYNLTISPIRGKTGDVCLCSAISRDVFTGEEAQVSPYKYPTFQEMYNFILRAAKRNGFYFDSYNDFGSVWYDIRFIDISDPAKIHKYGYRPEIGGAI